MAVATVAHSPLSSLYHTLKDVYSPLIKSQTAEGVPVLDKRLSELLAQVQAGLGTAVRKGTPVRGGVTAGVDRGGTLAHEADCIQTMSSSAPAHVRRPAPRRWRTRTRRHCRRW